MQSRIKLLPLLLVAFAAIVLAACASSGSSDKSGSSRQGSPVDYSSNRPDHLYAASGNASAYANPGSAGGGVPVDYVADAQAVIAQSGEKFSAADQDVSSMQGDVTFDFSTDTTAISGNATFLYQAPDGMYMTMAFSGGDNASLLDLSQLGTLEILSRDGSLYFNMPIFGGWLQLTPADMAAFGGDSYSGLLSHGSLFDYAGFTQGIGGAQYVGDEYVNGTSTVHYSVSTTLQSLIGAFGDALGATGDNALSGQVLGSELDGPLTVDVWVGKDDELPYKVVTVASLPDPNGTTMTMNLTATFHDYNAPVTLPPAPEDAGSFSDLLGALGAAPPPAAPTN